jgi:hypothetical protein
MMTINKKTKKHSSAAFRWKKSQNCMKRNNKQQTVFNSSNPKSNPTYNNNKLGTTTRKNNVPSQTWKALLTAWQLKRSTQPPKAITQRTSYHCKDDGAQEEKKGLE